MKRVIVVHGWGSNPSEFWFPWLQSELETRGVEAVVPAMPNPAIPTQSAWVTCLADVVSVPDRETFLVGHSLGGVCILRYLEGLTVGQCVGGVVLVASFPEPIGNDKADLFFDRPLKYTRIRRAVLGEIVALQSEDDPFVPYRSGELLRDALGARLVAVPHGGHFNADSGHFQLPELLQVLDQFRFSFL